MTTAILQARFGVQRLSRFRLRDRRWRGVRRAWSSAISVFRSGLRGSYFALVTLAFAEVFRIVANASSFTGGAAGTLLKLDVRAANFQFASRAIFSGSPSGLVTIVLIATRSDRTPRFGAYLVAIRENEDAARALGVDTLRVKVQAITLSAAITAAAGALLRAIFPVRRRQHRVRSLDLDRGAAGADHRRARDGVWTAGRRAGAARPRRRRPRRRRAHCRAPIVALYGALLVARRRLRADGLQGLAVRSAAGLRVQGDHDRAAAASRKAGKRFGGLLAVDAASLAMPSGAASPA